jgi:hypothetical protein
VLCTQLLTLLVHAQWLWEHAESQRREDWIAREAAAGGSVPMLRFLKQQGISFDTSALLSAARNGRTAACQYLYEEERCALTASACTEAARGGHTSTLIYLQQHGCELDVRAVCIAAARGGHIRVMEHVLQMQERNAHERTVPQELLTAMLSAAGVCNQRAAAQWLRDEHSAEWPAVLKDNSRAPYYTAWPERMVKWCRAQGCTSPTW